MSIMIRNLFNKDTMEINGNERRVQCVLCDNMISYTIFSDLKQHLVKDHSDYINILEIKKSTKPRESGYVSASWRHFRRTNCKYYAECKYCKNIFSYKSTKGNLKKHILRVHPEIDYDAVSEDNNDGEGHEDEDFNNAHSDGEQQTNEDLPLKRKAIREPSINTSCIEASNNNEQDTLLIPADRIKRRTSSETAADDDATERDQETEKEDVWNFFEKMPSNRAQCILCKESFNRHVPFLTKHLQEKHRKVALNLPSDSDEDQNCYTEVVYLEEEQPINVPKLKKMKQLPETRKRTSSSKYVYVNKPKDDEPASKNEGDEEIENFGRYIIGLLKKMPKDVSTQLQMDIISMIMTAKLKIGTSTSEANLSVSSVQIVSSDDIATAAGNVIVTTPSSVIHTTQNNESLPTLVIGVQDES